MVWNTINNKLYCVLLGLYSMKHMMSPDPVMGDVNLDHLVKMITIRFIHYKDF